MRKSLLLLLLAGAAIPTVAAAEPDTNSDDARAERAERQEARQQARAERAADAERAANVERPQTFVRSERGGGPDHAPVMLQQGAGSNNDDSDARPRRQFRQVSPYGGSAGQQAVQEVVREDGDGDDGVRNWRSEQRRSRGPRIVESNGVPDAGAPSGLRQSSRPVPNVFRTRIPTVSSTPREGTQPPLRAQRHSRERTHWSTSWRNSHRYDWRNWRNRHRSLFRLGFYYDPFGWNYRPYSIGWRLWPSYYSSRYWLSDPWMYRLPYAPPGTRWIRYYDDALLVDTFTGEVVDVIRNFFW